MRGFAKKTNVYFTLMTMKVEWNETTVKFLRHNCKYSLSLAQVTILTSAVIAPPILMSWWSQFSPVTLNHIPPLFSLFLITKFAKINDRSQSVTCIYRNIRDMIISTKYACLR